jgi:AcrR family transcriptional regulator
VVRSSSAARQPVPDDDVPQETGWDRRRRRIADRIERTAIELFARRGYRQVSIEDVAASAGISSRTVARYFPTKEDLLLAGPRRGYSETLGALDAIGPTRRPVNSVWEMWLKLAQDHKGDLEDALLWHKAAATAPEVVARALGENHLTLQAGLTTLCADALDADPETDPGPAVLAACLAAANRAAVDFWANKEGDFNLEELFAAAIRTLHREFSSRRLSDSVTDVPDAAQPSTRPAPRKR